MRHRCAENQNSPTPKLLWPVDPYNFRPTPNSELSFLPPTPPPQGGGWRGGVALPWFLGTPVARGPPAVTLTGKPKLQPDDYLELVKLLKRLLTDTNVPLVVLAIRPGGGLGGGGDGTEWGVGAFLNDLGGGSLRLLPPPRSSPSGGVLVGQVGFWWWIEGLSKPNGTQ